jgi:hypothetical protein
MKKYVVTVFNLRTHGLQMVDIFFLGIGIVTRNNVTRKVADKLGQGSFVVIAWSPVDEFSI